MGASPIKITIDNEACIFCMHCLTECPEDLFTVVEHTVQVKGEGLCYNACLACKSFCQGHAISIVTADSGSK